MLIENLIDFGLSDKEAKVYLALLELEVATANEVAKKSEINRSSTYVVLDSLKKQGLVNMSLDKIVKRYVATPPDILLYLAEKRAEKQEGIRNMIRCSLPDLRALHKDTKHKPKIMVYEGKDSMNTFYHKELLEPKLDDQMRSYEDLTVIEECLPGFIEKDLVERWKKGIKLYAINPATRKNLVVASKFRDKQNKDINVLIPENKYKSPNKLIDFVVYGDEVSFSSLQESFAIVIKHQEIADTLKKIFDLAWQEAKRIGIMKV
jgi:hypothetical protein